MKKLRPHFVYNKRQRNGVFYFLSFLVLLQIVYFFYASNDKFVVENESEILALNSRIDSLKNVVREQKKEFLINPNFITDAQGYELGMSMSEMDRLLVFRKKGKWCTSAEEFQRITKVSDSLLIVLTKRFKFPKHKKQTVQNTKKVAPVKFKDLNKANASDFKEIYGVGEVLSERIVKYRSKLGGFTFMSQLEEVWGLDADVINKIKAKYKIYQKPKLVKLNINKASFKEVLSIVYLDYEATKLIFQHRDSVKIIKDISEIKKIPQFPIDKYDRIVLYLQAE